MRKISLLLFMMCSLVSMTWAQRNISGAVTDSKGAPLIAATVQEKGTTNGSVTDFDGKYALTVKDGATLVFSYVGYTDQEATITASNVLNVTLAEGEVMRDVVVTALGVSREAKSLGYSTQQVGGDALTKNRETNIVNSLAGRVSGVQITGASGNMGGSSRILIRGARSVTGNNQPLFVVDGVPMDNSNFTSSDQARGAGGFDYGNAIQDINSDDVETINVLKGAAAAALYGSRANNGVILITTKKGSKSKAKQPIGVSLSSGVAVENVMLLPDLQNEYGGGYDFNGTDATTGKPIADFATDESWGPKLDGSPVRQWYSYDKWDTENYGKATPWSAQPNNVRDFFETGISFTNSIAVQGGNDVANFRASYTNLNIKGVMPNSKMDRNTISFNGGLKATDNLSVTMGANYVSNRALGRSGTGYDGQNVTQQFFQWGQRQWDITNMRKYINPDGTQRTWNRKSADDPTPNYTDNPYWTRNMNYQNDGRDRFYGNIAATYQFSKKLSATYRVLNDFYTDRRQERIAVGSQEISSYVEDVRTVNEFNTDLILNYKTNFGSDISFNGFVGGNMRKNTYKGNFSNTVGGLNVPLFYNISNSTSNAAVTSREENSAVNSAFASASFGYKSMLYLDVTGRNDVSSTLNAPNNSYFYPSVSSSFVFSELGALQNNKVLSYGKVRAGWAQVGNDALPYQSNGSNFSSHALFDGRANASVPNTLTNPNLKSELTTSWETGVELKFLKNRVGFDATYYNSLSENQILLFQSPAATGYSALLVNAGKISNQGIELMLNVSPIKTQNFEWNIAINWAKNMNKVLEFKLEDGTEVQKYRLANAPFAVEVAAYVGQPYGTIVGSDYTYTPDGQKIMDEDGVYIPSAVKPLGSVMPDWTGGINNSLTYKNISLSFLIDGQMGGSIFSTSHMWGTYAGTWAETTANGIRENGIENTGAVENPDGTFTTKTVKVDALTQFQGNTAYSLARISTFDASYLKLREIRMGYSLPARLLEKSPVRSMNFSLVARNVAILYKNMPGLDPDYVNSSGNVQGIEGAQLPPTRTVGFTLNVGF